MFKIGADPEVFVWDIQAQKFISAYGMVEGTKAKPVPVNYGAIQVDGMALEFNIDPANTEEEFLHNIKLVKDQLHTIIGKDKFDLKAIPTAHFDNDVWEKAPEEAKELGCDPDFNAWCDSEANVKPDNTKPMRTGAGHIHIGWGEGFEKDDPFHIATCEAVIQQLDCSLGLLSIQWDKDNERRTLYGKAGAYRPKPYGCEYRVLSNAWLEEDKLTSYVYTTAIKALEDLQKGIIYKDMLGFDKFTLNDVFEGIFQVPTVVRFIDTLLQKTSHKRLA